MELYLARNLKRQILLYLLSFSKGIWGARTLFSYNAFIRMYQSEMQKYYAYQRSSISLPVVLKFVELMLHLLVLHLHTTFLVSHPIAETTKTKNKYRCLKRSLELEMLGSAIYFLNVWESVISYVSFHIFRKSIQDER